MDYSASNRGKTALVTGASSGIGAELARLFAQGGWDVVLVARDRERLGRLAAELGAQHGVSARVMARDLSRSDSPGEIQRQLEAEGVRIDALVNNAGFGTHGPFAAADLKAELDQLQVNLVSLTHLTKLLLPPMLERGAGWILNVASTAAFQPGPLMAVYYATKAYVLSFSEALAEELRGSGVTVTALCPGPTGTEFQARAGMKHMKLARGRLMDAASVAQAGYQGMLEGKRLVIPGFQNWLLTQVVAFAPRRWVTRVVRWLQESRQKIRGQFT
ncbi:MAG TPA: SDR family oxidoreductase [Acidobacteriota bacterium]